MKARITRSSIWSDEKPHEGAIWDAEHKIWTMEIETIDEILSLYSVVVLSSAPEGEPYMFEVEIYDDYRE